MCFLHNDGEPYVGLGRSRFSNKVYKYFDVQFEIEFRNPCFSVLLFLLVTSKITNYARYNFKQVDESVDDQQKSPLSISLKK